MAFSSVVRMPQNHSHPGHSFIHSVPGTVATAVNPAVKVPLCLPEQVPPPNLQVRVGRPAPSQPSWDGFSHQSPVRRAPPSTRSFHSTWACQAGTPLRGGSRCRALGSAESAAAHTPLHATQRTLAGKLSSPSTPAARGTQHRLRASSGPRLP